MISDLERRYARWATLFYPVGNRRSELVGTYLSMAAPDRRRPSAADVADLAVGGLRQHLRVAEGFGPGFELAGMLALITATVLAAGSAILEVLTPVHLWSRPVGPFLTLGIAVWTAWLLAAAVHVARPGRWFRWTVVFAALLTVGTVPAAAVTGLPRPPLAVLLPQLVLGLLSLGASGRHRRWVRLLPIAAAVGTVPIAVSTAPHVDFSLIAYYGITETAMPAAAALLLITGTLVALGLAARRETRGAWALLILLTPIGMLALNPLGAQFDPGPGHGPIPAWSSMVIASALVAVIGPALVALAVAARGRRISPPVHRCPTCGAPSRSA